MQQGPWAQKAARRRTGLHTVLAVVFLAAAAGGGYLAVVQVPKWLRGPDAVATSPTPTPSPTLLDPLPGCRTPEFPDFQYMGTVAWVESGALDVVDLPTCRQQTLVRAGVDGPVHFSADGRWLAYGDATVIRVGARKAKPTTTKDATHAWAWSPTGARLAFVTTDGGVSLVDPGGKAQVVLTASAGRAQHVLWSPDGSKLAVDLPDRILVVHVASLTPSTVFTTSGPGPDLAGWTPDSHWVLFWAKPLGSTAGKVAGRALDVVPAGGGDWQNVWDSMLPFRDFVAPCGHDIAIAGGGRALVSEGKQILLTGPPAWKFHNQTNDYLRSWAWPACSPDAKFLAATSTANNPEGRFGGSIRKLWVISVASGKREHIDPPGLGAYETARWAPDGRVIMVIQRATTDWDSPGSIALVEVDPGTGKVIQAADLGIDVGSAPGAGGHQHWTENTDWYRPPPPSATPASPTPSPSTSG
jgi:dipeptidyl aminopeptidase/acylaminoacyl peptidase